MRSLTKPFLFSLLAVLGGCASTSKGRCANCDRAQGVVTSVAEKHPEVVRLSLHCGMGEEMKYCASTDTSRIGRASDPEDRRALQSVEPIVLDENGNIDVTLPVNKKDGKPQAVLGVTVKGSGTTRDQALQKSKAIAKEVEAGLGGDCSCCCENKK